MLQLFSDNRIPPFAKPGQKIDINVSTIGVAESLRGGTLVVTPLRGLMVKSMQ